MFEHIYEQETNYVTESLKRCRELNVDPYTSKISQNIMSKLELGRKKGSYKEILDVVKYFSNKMLKSLGNLPVLIAITDEKGYLLDILGNEAISETMNKLGIKPGAQISEAEMGTNVVTLALREKQPVQLVGNNHYNMHLQNSACYGVPFRSTNNKKILGSICIMTTDTLHNPFFLMTLTTVVDAVERELLLRKQNRKINRQQQLLYKSEKRQRELLEKDLIMKDEFITLISHEFKTPINVIYSAIQLIERVYINKISQSVINIIGNIKRNSFRQLRLVNNLLDITKLNSKQFKLNLKNVDIVILTKQITESIAVYAGQKEININFKTNVNSINTSIDDEKYERIILNLLSNAIKFTPEGGSITVEVKENEKDRTVAIAVIDTGSGIPKDKREMIFQRFGQVNNNLSRQAEGSGIGLALVKMLTEILEGHIKLDSELGIGSVFTITLPIKEEVVEEKNRGFITQENGLVNAINVEFSDIYF